MYRKVYTFVCVLLFITAAGAWSAPNERLKVGDEFPSFGVKDLKGEFFFLREHVGNNPKKPHKALLFSFCTSYCQPCRKEYPELEKIREKYAPQGLGCYLIDVGEKEETVQVLAAEIKTRMGMLVDRYGVVFKLVGQPGTPHTVLLDGDGKVRFINTGFSEDKAGEIIAEMEKQIAAILGAGGAPSTR
ncbi:MAG: TlpA family protein disulfide reductase [Candidatus Latescibacterota bacterium]